MLQKTPLQLRITRGAPFAEVVRLMQGGTRRPVDLTGFGPYYCQVRDPEDATLLLELTVTEVDAADGRLQLAADSAATADLAAAFQRGVFDVIDAAGNIWLAGSAYLGPSTTELPDS
jgi:hypothetical protein